MGVSGGDTGLLGRNDWAETNTATQQTGKNTMKTTIKYIAPWLIAAAVGGAIGLAPVASAEPGSMPVPHAKVVANPVPSPGPAQTPFGSGEDPLVPSGADPYIPYVLGAPFKNPAGGVDLPS